MPQATTSARDPVRGDATGLALPVHGAALREAGTGFLTEAFRAFGSLGADDAVARIVACEPFAGGNSGDKVALEVAYARPDPALHTRLFVKFSRDFVDPFRDRRRHELASEVRIALLARSPAFPVRVAKPYFADFHEASGTGILIAERIAFGEGGIEPLRAKCRDHELPNALEHYRATVGALARLAAAHHAGRLDPEADALFPYDPATAAAAFPIMLDQAQLHERVANYARFAAACPQLLPPAITEPGFIAMLRADATRVLAHQHAVRRFLHADRRLVALTHWNTNLDNAWFWRDAGGVLRCGLLDWGMARPMNLAYDLWGGLSAAEPAMLLDHLDELLALFAAECRAHGGPALDPAELRLHFDLALALLGLALMIDVPALVLARVPDAVHVQSPRDLLHADPVAGGFLHVFTNFLLLWKHHRFGASLDRILARS